MVDLGKAASKIAQRQANRAKSRIKSQTRLKVRQVSRTAAHNAKEKAKEKATAAVATRRSEAEEAPADLTQAEPAASSGTQTDWDWSESSEDLTAQHHAYPPTNIPVGFKPPRGLKLINDPDEIPEPFDWSKVPWKKIGIAVGALVGITAVTLGLLWAVPKVVDLVRDAEVPAVPALPTLPTVPVTQAPATVLTVWGEGACVTSGTDGTARPSTCNEADYEVTGSIEYPDLELTSEEVRSLQELMTSLGVVVVIDGVLGPQTRLAIDSFAVSAGLDPSANDRAKAAAVRAASLVGGAAADGPRLLQNSPEFCGAGVVWVEDARQIHCLAPL